jgi:hypothetical protein
MRTLARIAEKCNASTSIKLAQDSGDLQTLARRTSIHQLPDSVWSNKKEVIISDKPPRLSLFLKTFIPKIANLFSGGEKRDDP